jgi:hypothetical protein
MKTEQKILPNIGEVSDTPKQNPKCLRRLARVCAIATAIAIVPVHSVLADADDQHQQILPFPTVAKSTIPTNGDVNPYGGCLCAAKLSGRGVAQSGRPFGFQL